jgi:glycerophosphoryl diester phosphodiesterase
MHHAKRLWHAAAAFGARLGRMALLEAVWMGDLIRFAHRGAPARGQAENSLAAFEAALRSGAEGLESDVRLTADGVPVLVHGAGLIGRRRLRSFKRTELPARIPSLEDLWERCGCDFELALDMSDPDAAAIVVELAQRYGAVSRLWLTYWRLPELARWRQRWPQVKLVYATMFGFPDRVFRRSAAGALDARVDALNLHHRLIVRRTPETAHALGLRLFAWGLRRPQHLRRMAAFGVDGAFVDDLSERG